MKELLHEKGLWTASVICAAAMMVGFPFYQVKPPLETGSFLKFLQEALEAQILLFLIPAAAVLPVGASYVRESSTGFLKLYILKMNRTEYVKRKTLQIYAGGFLPFFFAGAGLLLCCFLFLFPVEFQGIITWQMFWKPASVLLRISLIGGIMAEVSGIFAAVSENYYMAYGLPFVSYYMLIILKERYFTEFYALYPAEWVKCQQDWGVDGTGIWMFLAVFSVVVMLLHSLLLYGRLQEIE